MKIAEVSIPGFEKKLRLDEDVPRIGKRFQSVKGPIVKNLFYEVELSIYSRIRNGDESADGVTNDVHEIFLACLSTFLALRN